MISLLFVCTGNTCRSPLAEYMGRQMLASRGLSGQVQVGSAGIYARPGEAMTAPAQEVLTSLYNTDAWVHRSRRADEALLEESDLILTMTADQASWLTAQFPAYAARIYTLAEASRKAAAELTGIIEVVPEGSLDDVPDPYGQSREVYEETAGRIRSYLAALVDWLELKVNGDNADLPDEI